MADVPDKTEYFKQLYALNDSEEDEEDTNNDVREFLKRAKRSVPAESWRRSQPANPLKKTPAILRTNSAPVSNASVVKETPLVRKGPLLRYDLSTPPSAETTFTEKIPQPGPPSSHRSDLERRTVSDPARGSLVLKNSSGIASMLQKKQKRKREVPIKLRPEKERIFQGKVFFYIPADDITIQRRIRITKARTYGAIWQKEFGSDITHVVVDKDLTYEDVMKYLAQTFKIDALPENMILVNEEYPIECIVFGSILDPKQNIYAVKGSKLDVKEEAPTAMEVASQSSDKSLGLDPPKSGANPDIQTQVPLENDSEIQQPSQRAVYDVSRILETPQGRTSPETSHRSSRTGDVFDEMIALAQRTRHLPLDDVDESERDRPSSSSGAEDSESSRSSNKDKSPTRAAEKKRKGPKGTGTNKGPFNQDNLSCMKGSTGTSDEANPNAATIKLLSEMADYYEQMKESWKPQAYRKAISTLRRQAHRISTFEEAFALPTIGERLAKKIESIALTGRLLRLEHAKSEPSDDALRLFMKIYGVGQSQANKWVQQGHNTLSDLVKNVHLTTNQKIGIEHYTDFDTRIPRSEVTALGDIVKKAAKVIDPEVDATIGGSYRRGASDSGDIDFLITKKGTKDSSELMGFLNELVSYLTQTGFLVAALAVPSSEDGTKWHGACVLPPSSDPPPPTSKDYSGPIWRRIDLLLVPASEFGAALIYFTGDDIFNRSIRLLARYKGWRLNEKGLYKDVMRGSGRAKMNERELIEGKDEERVFEILEVPWRKPEERICR